MKLRLLRDFPRLVCPDRYCIAVLFLLIFAASVLSAQTTPPPFDITTKRLSPRVAVFYGDPWDNAIVAVATAKGILVIDAPFSKTIAKGFRDAIQVEFNRTDFAYLINTHDHACHVGGNEAFSDLPIVGHVSLRREMLKSMNDPDRVAKLRGVSERELARTREFLQKNYPQKLQDHGFLNYEKSWKIVQADYDNNPLVVPPTVTFDRDMTLYLGDVSARLSYYGHAHAVADTIVSIPEENLVLTAGIFGLNSVPVTDKVTAEATPAIMDNWFVLMHRVLNESNENTKFIASHGRTVMTKEQIQQSVSYLEDLWTKVRRAKAGGKTLEQAKADIPLKDFLAVAKLPNQVLPGTEWEIPDIHQQNIENMWKVLGS